MVASSNGHQLQGGKIVVRKEHLLTHTKLYRLSMRSQIDVATNLWLAHLIVMSAQVSMRSIVIDFMTLLYYWKGALRMDRQPG